MSVAHEIVSRNFGSFGFAGLVNEARFCRQRDELVKQFVINGDQSEEEGFIAHFADGSSMNVHYGQDRQNVSWSDSLLETNDGFWSNEYAF